MSNVIYITGPAGSGKTFKAIKEHLDDNTVLVNNEEVDKTLEYLARGAGKSSQFKNCVVVTDESGTMEDEFMDTALRIIKLRNKYKTLIWDCNKALIKGDIDQLSKVFDKVVVTVLTRTMVQTSLVSDIIKPVDGS
jgi:nucleoside-triphosphatase THEP1